MTQAHPAYLAALAADGAFQAELVRVYGLSKAQDARYRTAAFTDAGVRQAYKAKLVADGAWLKVMRESAIARHREVR